MCSARFVLSAILVWLCLPAFAAAAGAADVAAVVSDERTELLRLTEARAVIAQQFQADSEQCARRFFVNACVDEAKDKRNAALRPLEARAAVLDANQRRARAEAQRERASQREREFADAEGRQRTAQLLAAQPAATSPDPKERPAVASATIAQSKRQPGQIMAQTEQKEQKEQKQQKAQKEQKEQKAQDEAKRRELQKANFQSEQLLRQQEAERRRALNEAKQKGKKPPLALPIPSAAEIEAAGSAAPPVKR